MAQVVWTQTNPDQWEGVVAGTTWFRVDPVFGSWYLYSALPLPLDSNGLKPTEAEAKALAQRAVDAFTALAAA